MEFHIGIDSTDNKSGGCTTWTVSRIIDKLYNSDNNIKFINFPRLIRLNPNIKLKTRGNAALSISIKSSLELDQIIEICRSIIEVDIQNYEDLKTKGPGLVVFVGRKPVSKIYNLALYRVLTLDEVLDELKPDYYWPKGSPGIIGAISAVSAELDFDFTYEFILYRKYTNFGRRRIIDSELVRISELNNPTCFSSFDFENNRELIAPSGADPIFCGIRSSSLLDFLKIYNNLKIKENLDSWTIYQSNQGTDAHVSNLYYAVSESNSISTLVTVVSQPKILIGSHVILKIAINQNYVDCIAFEPTKKLSKTVAKLIVGDQIYIHGNVKNNKFGLHIALEFMLIVNLENNIIKSPPNCTCGKKTTSLGKFKGYRCKSCRKITYIPSRKFIQRELYLGQRIYASASSQRHLTRPLKRLNHRNQNLGMKDLNYNQIRGYF